MQGSPAVTAPSAAAPPALRVLRYGLWALLLMVLLGLVAVWWYGPGRMVAEATRLPVLGAVPSFRLTDSHGAAVTAADLRGRPWVVGLIFTRCRTACPLLVERLAALGDELPPDLLRVALSVDPEHDRPPVLATFAHRHDAEGAGWLFLTGETAEVRRLAVEGLKLGVATTPPDDPRAAEEPITHSTRLVLVDAAGQVRGYYDAFDREATATLARHARALWTASPRGAVGRPTARSASGGSPPR